jgi:hypothetical protein
LRVPQKFPCHGVAIRQKLPGNEGRYSRMSREECMAFGMLRARLILKAPQTLIPGDFALHLWTEYEGNTIAGKYTLGPLQRSEGRNGFFLTEHAGKPATLRLTEALNDEDMLFTRWQSATTAAASQPSLLPILDFGRTALEGVPLAWALIERSDGSLSDALRERALTIEETKEVAVAVACALSALHSAGLVHEHVDVSNVVAVGETVKLRSDCVRECVGEFENDTLEAREALRQRDIHDFGLMLVRCLPIEQARGDSRLPAPFDRIVPGALNGALSLSEILVTLTGVRPAAPVAAAISGVPSAVAGLSGAASGVSGTVPGVSAVAQTLSAEPARPQFRPRKSSSAALPRLSTLPPAQPAAARPDLHIVTGPPLATERAAVDRRSLKTITGKTFDRVLARVTVKGAGPYWAGGAIAAALLGIVMWNTGGPRATPAPYDKPKARAQATAAPVAVPTAHAVPAAKPSASESLMASMEPGWHVIAYTYNYEKQARAKAVDLQKKYIALQPHVFTPTGHAPYFVALGNGLGQTDATALLHQARRAGLPSDTYIKAFSR